MFCGATPSEYAHRAWTRVPQRYYIHILCTYFEYNRRRKKIIITATFLAHDNYAFNIYKTCAFALPPRRTYDSVVICVYLYIYITYDVPHYTRKPLLNASTSCISDDDDYPQRGGRQTHPHTHLCVYFR